MSGRDLDAAGIDDPALRASYRLCRRLNARHGRTYYLATLLLPPAKRPHVHALYGFARFTDDLVDDVAATPDQRRRAERFHGFADRVRADLAAGHSTHPVTAALLHTLRRWRIPVAHVEAFLDAMAQDLTATSYASYADLERYMYGSAAVIGLQMVPILEHPGYDRAVVEPYARDLGLAFQLVNFIRDVGEDLARGRLYLPGDDLAAFGVDRERLAAGVTDEPVRQLLAFEIDRARSLLARAAPGIELLAMSSRDCVRTAAVLYGGILAEVERAGYAVLRQRVAVGPLRRARVALPALIRARRARRA